MSEIDLTVGREVRGDIALVVLLHFITSQSLEERGKVGDGEVRPFGDCSQRPLVGAHERLQCGAVQRNVSGIDRDPNSRDLEVIADPCE